MIVNGRYQTDIDIADRGLQYGDGCFTTIAFRNTCLEFFDAHLQRLQQACHRLHIDFNQWTELSQYVVNSVVGNDQDSVIKILISRGQGGRGYSPVGCQTPSYIITHHPMPAHYGNWQDHGLALSVSPVTLAKQPLLAGIKHLNRLEQVLIKKELEPTEFDDALVCDTDGTIIETSVGNLFWKNDNTWFTPELSQCGVEGVVRNQLLDIFLKNEIDVQVVQQDLNGLDCIEEMFMCNSLMKIVPVTSIYQPKLNVKIKVLTHHQTKQFQTWFDQIPHQQAASFL